MKDYLFVGGEHSGQRYQAPRLSADSCQPIPIIKMPIPTPFNVEEQPSDQSKVGKYEEYRLESIGCNFRTFYIYVLKSMPIEQALALILGEDL